MERIDWKRSLREAAGRHASRRGAFSAGLTALAVVAVLVFNLLLLVSALLVFTDWFNGYTGYSLDLVVPILCCTALVCNFIFAFLRSRFTANALVYLLMNIGIGVLPYILLFFRIDYSGRLDAHSLPWVICLIISVITFLGLVIFRGRALKNEIVKRLHM